MAEQADNNEARQQTPLNRPPWPGHRHRDRRLQAARDLCGKIQEDMYRVDMRLFTNNILSSADPQVSHAALMLLCEAQNAISAALVKIE